MKRSVIIVISVLMVVLSRILVSCDSNADSEENFIQGRDCIYLAGMPGTYLFDMAIDNNNIFYYFTGETDKEAWAKTPAHSSSIPMKGYLSRKDEEIGKFEILVEYFGGKLCFDKNNKLLVLHSNAIYKLDDNSFDKTKILETNKEYSGSLSFIAVDNDNNIWTGGLQTGLYKIDNELNVTHYNVNNSILPTNSMTAIHIDKNNNIWIALWEYMGVLKISNDQWDVYSNISSNNIWSLITDKNGHLWIGTGFFNEANQSLRCFDGTKWETINPQNKKNEMVKGSVRHLQSDGKKIYVVSEHVNVFPGGGGAELTSNELYTFDGTIWNKIYDIPDDDSIRDLIVDHFRKAMWVITAKKGIVKIPFD